MVVSGLDLNPSPLRRQGARGVAPPAHRAGAPGATCQNAKMVYSPLRRQGERGVAPPAHRAGAHGATCCAPGAAERRRGLVTHPYRMKSLTRGGTFPEHQNQKQQQQQTR